MNVCGCRVPGWAGSLIVSNAFTCQVFFPLPRPFLARTFHVLASAEAKDKTVAAKNTLTPDGIQTCFLRSSKLVPALLWQCVMLLGGRREQEDVPTDANVAY